MTSDHTPFDDLPGGSQGDRDLEDRAALRRVQSLSTELSDITEVEYRQLQLEQVLLVGVWSGASADEAEESMAELARLAETAGSVVLDAMIQRRDRPDPATYIGSGKVVELGELVNSSGADTVICDGELSPGQLRNLEEKLRVKVVDRTALILDIFAQHARSKEGKAQVELAQLNYLLPRLRGWGIALSRQRGGRVAGGAGIGSRGPGETKLEIDRRRITKRIAQLLGRELSAMTVVRETKPDAASQQRHPCRLDHRLHQRGEVEPAEPAHHRRRSGRGRPVRDAGSDHPAHQHRGRPGLHADRHRRLRPPPAAPADRVVPVDVGGGRRVRPDRARHRRLRRAAGAPGRRGARGAGLHRRGERARTAGGEQVGRRGRSHRGPAAAPVPGRRIRLRPQRSRDRRITSADRRTAAGSGGHGRRAGALRQRRAGRPDPHRGNGAEPGARGRGYADARRKCSRNWLARSRRWRIPQRPASQTKPPAGYPRTSSETPIPRCPARRGGFLSCSTACSGGTF